MNPTREGVRPVEIKKFCLEKMSNKFFFVGKFKENLYKQQTSQNV